MNHLSMYRFIFFLFDLVMFNQNYITRSSSENKLLITYTRPLQSSRQQPYFQQSMIEPSARYIQMYITWNEIFVATFIITMFVIQSRQNNHLQQQTYIINIITTWSSWLHYLNLYLSAKACGRVGRSGSLREGGRIFLQVST